MSQPSASSPALAPGCTRPEGHVSVEVFLPVCGDAAGRSRCRLPARVMRRLRQRRAFVELLSPVVPEPVLPRLEALDDRVPGLPRMVRGVLGGRGVTTTDMSALSAAAQVQPPAIARHAFRTAGAVRWYRRFDSMRSHVAPPSTRGVTRASYKRDRQQHSIKADHNTNAMRCASAFKVLALIAAGVTTCRSATPWKGTRRQHATLVRVGLP
jgi:hypothetical protein